MPWTYTDAVHTERLAIRHQHLITHGGSST